MCPLYRMYPFERITHCECPRQKEEGTCLGAPLTVADAAYVFSSSHLSTHEEGETRQQRHYTVLYEHFHLIVHIHQHNL